MDKPAKALDLQFVRQQFPAFHEPTLQNWRHFENAGGSYACRQVIERLQRFYTANKVQPYYYSGASEEGGRQMDAARDRFAALLNVQSDEVNFGPSTTQNTYNVAQALRQHCRPGDEIVVTNQDHEANIGPWRRLAEDGLVVREWCIDPITGELNPADLEALLGERTRAVAFTHCSNIIGSINPAREIVARVQAAGAWAIVDGVSFCGHSLPDVGEMGADLYLFSLYKVYGPHLGVMVMRPEMNQALPNQGHYFNESLPTARYTPAGPDHAQIAASNGVVDYFESVYQHHLGHPQSGRRCAATVGRIFSEHEHRLLQPLLDYLDRRPDLSLIGGREAQTRAPTVAVVTLNRDPHDVARSLAGEGIFAGVGHFYAARCLKALGVDPAIGVLRMSFVHYTSSEDIGALILAMDRILEA